MTTGKTSHNEISQAEAVLLSQARKMGGEIYYSLLDFVTLSHFLL